jgi:hypothetical protein
MLLNLFLPKNNHTKAPQCYVIRKLSIALEFQYFFAWWMHVLILRILLAAYPL